MCTQDDVEAQRWGTIAAIMTGMKEQRGDFDDEDEEEDYEDYEDDDYDYEGNTVNLVFKE